MIGNICDMPKVLEIMRIVGITISIIRIAVPIILILSIMIKLVRVVMSNKDDELSKMGKVIVRNIIAAVLVFLMPVFVRVIVDIVDPNNEYEKCLQVSSLEDIRKIYNDQEEDLVKKAEESENIYDYSNAYSNLTNIKDSNKRKELS